MVVSGVFYIFTSVSYKYKNFHIKIKTITKTIASYEVYQNQSK